MVRNVILVERRRAAGHSSARQSTNGIGDLALMGQTSLGRKPPRSADSSASRNSSGYQPFCQETFERLAREQPNQLVELIRKERIPDPADLTFAAESLQRAPNDQGVLEVLMALLSHPSPLVREGAIYGWASHMTLAAMTAIQRLASSDPSRGVRAAAQAALEDTTT
jgi:HEAT repeat protein